MSNDPAPQMPTGYMPQLDSLRAIGMATVALAHWTPKRYQMEVPGYFWMMWFFVLSGFLITSILFRCREAESRGRATVAFYARRFLRILPAYYLILFIAYAANVPPVRETFAWHATYLSNVYFILHQGWDGPVSHFWTLAVEEQFYLFWPVAILLVPSRALPATLVTLTLSGVVSRVGLAWCFPDVDLLWTLPNCNFDAFGLGALLAYAFTRPQYLKWVPRAAVISLSICGVLALMLLAGVPVPVPESVGTSLLLVSLMWVTYKAAFGFRGPLGRLLEWSPLVYVGRISYGLYLLHNFAPVAVGKLCEAAGYPMLQYGLKGLVLKGLWTFVLAVLSWHLFEAPLNSLKRYFPYRKKVAKKTAEKPAVALAE